MRVSGISHISPVAGPNKLSLEEQSLFNWVRRTIRKGVESGQSRVSFIFKDNPVHNNVLNVIKQDPNLSVTTEKSDSMRVTIGFR